MSERKAFLLRIDPRLHDALKRWAEDELRSLNSQAELLLRDAVRRAGRLKLDDESGSNSTSNPSGSTPARPGSPEPSPADDPSAPD